MDNHNKHNENNIEVMPMKEGERTALAVLGGVSLAGGASAFIGSIISKSINGFFISIPFIIIGIISIYIAAKGK